MSNVTESPLEQLPEWSVILFDAIMVVIMIVGVAGNTLILLVESFNKQKTSTDWLVVALSANDILVAGFNAPIYILFYGGNWKHLGSDFICKLNTFIQDTFSYCSTLLLSVNAIDRYIKTCRPHDKGITTNRSKWICLSVFLASVIIGTPILLTYKFHPIEICKFTESEAWGVYAFYIVMFIQITFFAMFVTVIVCYSKIAYVIRYRLRRTGVVVDPPIDSRAVPTKSLKACSSLTNISGRHSTKHTDLCGEGIGNNSCSVNSLVLQDVHSQVNRTDESLTGIWPLSIDASSLQQGRLKHNKNSCTLIESTQLTTLSSDLPNKHATPNRKVFTRRQNPRKGFKRTTVPQTTLQQNKVNRTTLIMFAVTLVFLLSWIPPWIVAAKWPNNYVTNMTDRIIVMFLRRTFIVNTVTNPLFYIGMSSNFRALTKTVLRKMRLKIRCRS